jgi:hypothetical protein
MEEFFNYYDENHQLFRGIFDRIINAAILRFAEDFEDEISEPRITTKYIAFGSEHLDHIFEFRRKEDCLQILFILPNNLLPFTNLLDLGNKSVNDIPNNRILKGIPRLDIYSVARYEELQNHITDWIIGTYRYQLSLEH